MSSTTPEFLGLPLEIRLYIYSSYLALHRRILHDRQPSNEHIRLLRVSKQIYAEASPTMWTYVSLLYEGQIKSFVSHTSDETLLLVQSVDVANDGRVQKVPKTCEDDPEALPLSKLYTALSKLPSLRHLRVFECRRGLPVSMHSLRLGSRRFILSFEDAMFPSRLDKQLSTYELYLNSGTRASLFTRISPTSLTALRLSGDCQLPSDSDMRMPALRDVTLLNVTGNYFDRHTLDQCFRDAELQSFRYALGDRLAFEIRDYHLESLCAGPGQTLRTLVLIGCSRLSSASIAACIASLPQLHYLALSVVTVEEQRTNFVLAVPHSVAVFKLHVINAWYAIPLLDEERGMCDAIESHILSREPPPELVALHFRSLLTDTERRRTTWESLASRNGIELRIGPWEPEEIQ